MARQDFQFAVQITDQMNWGMLEEDFEFLTKLEPGGCFVLFDGQEKVGIATTVSFGKIGWFGNLIVRESHRKKGAGSMLVSNAVDYLESKGVQTVGLYAYVDKVDFYERLGFEYDSEFGVLKGGGFSSPNREGVLKAGRKDMRQILNCDGVCFGASRKKIIEPILNGSSNLGYKYMEGNIMLGYVLAKVWNDIADVGPLVCPKGHSDIAISLLEAVLTRLKDAEVSLCVPRKEESILSMLVEKGFTESFPVARMFLHPGTVNRCVYLAESLERG